MIFLEAYIPHALLYVNLPNTYEIRVGITSEPIVNILCRGAVDCLSSIVYTIKTQ